MLPQCTTFRWDTKVFQQLLISKSKAGGGPFKYQHSVMEHLHYVFVLKIS